MPTSLNQAAEHRAALNWIGVTGPLACSGLVILAVAVRMVGPWPHAVDALLGNHAYGAMLRALFAAQIPFEWLFIETTSWRRPAQLRRGRRVLIAQVAALAVALVVVKLG